MNGKHTGRFRYYKKAESCPKYQNLSGNIQGKNKCDHKFTQPENGNAHKYITLGIVKAEVRENKEHIVRGVLGPTKRV